MLSDSCHMSEGHTCQSSCQRTPNNGAGQGTTYGLRSTILWVYCTVSVITIVYKNISLCSADKISFKVLTDGNYFDYYSDMLETKCIK